MSFPKSFMIGAATAAHQVEGDNIHSDNWAMEHMKTTAYLEPSGLAVDHYHRYAEDIRLLADAGLNAYRFSVEWARIEPEKGEFHEEEIEHYRDVIRCCREHSVEPVVTLHHFSSPLWLIREGGWNAETTIEYFRRYCVYVIERLGKDINYVCTMNEANMCLQLAAILARQDEQAGEDGGVQIGFDLKAMKEKDNAAASENREVFGTPTPQPFVTPRTAEEDTVIVRAHEAARNAIKKKCPHLKVGLTLSLFDVQAGEPGGEPYAEGEWNDEFLRYLPYIQGDDFIGVQNYSRSRYGRQGRMPNQEGVETTQMGYEFYPEALANVIRKVHRDFHGAILVTENGVAVSDDTRRIEFIRRALAGVEDCVAEGLPVLGYLYWSLLDNFEWQSAYSMTFGLIAVDRTTMTRAPKPSLVYLGSVAKGNKN